MVEVFYKIDKQTKKRVYYKKYKNGTVKIIDKETYTKYKKKNRKNQKGGLVELLIAKDDPDNSLDFHLSEYFIFSTHNTYCTSVQFNALKSPEVALEPYKYLLERFKGGCYEIDTVDPVTYVKNGVIVSDLQVWHSLPNFTSLSWVGLAGSSCPIYFRDIMKIIIDYVINNPTCYPIILSLDMKNKSDTAMITLSEICKELFMTNYNYNGSKILGLDLITNIVTISDKLRFNTPIKPYEPECTLRSVMGKILFKNGTWDTAKYSDLWLHQYMAFPKNDLMKSLVDNTKSLEQIKDFKIQKEVTSALKTRPRRGAVSQTQNGGGTQMQYYRIYPKASEVYSLNFDPFEYWMNNAQMVALNMQTNDNYANMNTLVFYNTPYIHINKTMEEKIRDICACVLEYEHKEPDFFKTNSFLTDTKRCSSNSTQIYLKRELNCKPTSPLTYCFFRKVTNEEGKETDCLKNKNKNCNEDKTNIIKIPIKGLTPPPQNNNEDDED